MIRRPWILKEVTTHVLIGVAVVAATSPAPGQHTARISVNCLGIEANGDSWPLTGVGRCISASGRWVVFCSLADNLDCSHVDSNGTSDCFIHDRDVNNTGVFDQPGNFDTKLVSLDWTGTHAGSWISSYPSISANGRWVVFTSSSDDIVPGISGTQTYVRDLEYSTTTVASVDCLGRAVRGLEAVISDDGRFVAFDSETMSNLDCNHPKTTNMITDTFLHDRDVSGNGVFDEPGDIDTLRVSGRWCDGEFTAEGNNHSIVYDVSADGRFVAFHSYASNLLCGDCPGEGDCNHATDDFVFDRIARRLTRVNVSTSGVEANNGSGAPSISGDGRFVVFASGASTLTDPPVPPPAVYARVFLRDRDLHGFGPEHYDEPGNVGTIVISKDSAGNWKGGDGTRPDPPSISRNGQYIALLSYDRFVLPDTPGYMGVYWHDREYNSCGTFDELGCFATLRMSAATDCKQADERSEGAPSVSADGRHVAFDSWARNLVGPPDGAARRGIYVRDRGTCKVPAVTLHPVSTGPNEPVYVCDTAMLETHAIGDPPLSYQWRKYLVPGDPNTAVPVIDDPNHIWGATAPTLAIRPRDPNDSGMYDCVVTNDCLCSETWSAPATLTVSWRLGDMNCDGVVDFFDIDAFVRALSGPVPYYALYPDCRWLNGDCDGDGHVTFGDIDPFVDRLGDGCP